MSNYTKEQVLEQIENLYNSVDEAILTFHQTLSS